MRDLRTNTATRVTVGPFIDKTDGFTPEVALTATNEKLTLVVDDAGVPTLVLDTTATASGGSNDMVHITGDDAGFYDLELAAANVNYLGRAMLCIGYATDHLPVFHEFMILTADEYDRKYATTDAVPASGILDRGQLQSISSTGGALRSAAAFGDSTLVGATIAVKGSTQGYWQTRMITANANSGDTFTVDAWTVTPSGGTYDYVIFAGAPAGAADATAIRSAVGLATANLDTQLGDLPTNAELATSQAAADDATLAAIAAVDAKIDTIDNLLDTEMPALTTAVDALPTNAELATALAAADDAVLAAIGALPTAAEIVAAEIAALDGFDAAATTLLINGVAHTITRDATGGWIATIVAD